LNPFPKFGLRQIDLVLKKLCELRHDIADQAGDVPEIILPGFDILLDAHDVLPSCEDGFCCPGLEAEEG
jgi:hypothetical protein